MKICQNLRLRYVLKNFTPFTFASGFQKSSKIETHFCAADKYLVKQEEHKVHKRDNSQNVNMLHRGGHFEWGNGLFDAQ